MEAVFLFFFFLACRLLVPQPGIEPQALSSENREFLTRDFPV